MVNGYENTEKSSEGVYGEVEIRDCLHVTSHRGEVVALLSPPRASASPGHHHHHCQDYHQEQKNEDG